MHEALTWIARAIALAHDHWRTTFGRRRPLSGKIAVLEEQVQRLRVENDLLRARWLRVPAKRRPTTGETSASKSCGTPPATDCPSTTRLLPSA